MLQCRIFSCICNASLPLCVSLCVKNGCYSVEVFEVWWMSAAREFCFTFWRNTLKLNTAAQHCWWGLLRSKLRLTLSLKLTPLSLTEICLCKLVWGKSKVCCCCFLFTLLLLQKVTVQLTFLIPVKVTLCNISHTMGENMQQDFVKKKKVLFVLELQSVISLLWFWFCFSGSSSVIVIGI